MRQNDLIYHTVLGIIKDDPYLCCWPHNATQYFRSMNMFKNIKLFSTILLIFTSNMDYNSQGDYKGDSDSSQNSYAVLSRASFRNRFWLFQILYEGEILPLFTVAFWGLADFHIINTC